MGGPRVDSNDMHDYYRRNDYFGSSSYHDSGSNSPIDVTPRRIIRDAREVFDADKMKDEFNPAKIKLPRTAHDSAQSPHSRGMIWGLDLTGSNQSIALRIIQKYYPEIISKTYDAVSFDPHIMFMGITDVSAGDIAPLQVTQFETDLRMLEQLKKIYIEPRCGGGNGSESYILAWYFAAKFCDMDCLKKRGEKGFLFTWGDENPTPKITPYELREVFGNREELDTRNLSPTDCLEMASEKFYCYHIILHGCNYDNYVVRNWKNLMGGHACDLSDEEYLPDLMATILRMYEGDSKTEALAKITDTYSRRAVESALCDHEETVEDKKIDVAESSQIEIF